MFIDGVQIDGTERPVCVMTRVRLRGPWSLIRFVWHYRRVQRTLDGVPGLMHVSLTAEGPLTWHMLSVWRTEEFMGRWANTPEHIDAVRTTYHGLTRESWSGRWRLETVSPSARQWQKAPALESVLGSSEGFITPRVSQRQKPMYRKAEMQQDGTKTPPPL